MMNAMMSETVEDGTASKAAFAWPAAGKTGTSQNSRDAWFIGYTANLTTGVWFGNDDGSPMKKVTGGALPAVAWHEFMVAAHEGVPVAQLPGGWSGATAAAAAPKPQLDVGRAEQAAVKPAVRPVSRSAGSRRRAGRTSPADGCCRAGAGRKPPRSAGRSADVGDSGKRKKQPTSILDAILGNGQ